MADVFDLSGRRIYVAGATGMVGGALVRRLGEEPCEILTTTRAELDLTRQADVETWFDRVRPDAVILAAARVGGIGANSAFPAEFLNQNLAIQTNVIQSAHDSGCERLLFLGSSCIYPRNAPQPMLEEHLMQGPLEPTNEGYALAKIAGIRACQYLWQQHGRRYISAMPTNLFGPGDTFDLEAGHVIPAMIVKFVEAVRSKSPTVTIWGTGSARREFMHADDCADALVYLLQHYDQPEHINVGTGEEVSILQLAELVAELTGFDGEIVKDTTKPDGMPRKLMDSGRLRALGWTPRIGLRDGLAATINTYRRQTEAAHA
ncbi:GDP-L-fucose synthase [Jannaschia sp. M317]|uniref:GDP-L-fucose synthase family protein n=1 Tax=Jannaschia sp. M317 TaxID=2867011 RepID=UPI0021A860CE|nr:GDP-L-fucose synthase [Jannaschia sp. M317]UWQ19632.1 GDP-L-fucose synthase [Jannaschia sp. M317]